ncbi:TPA: hypothetical protein ACWXF7_002543 [Klebsiella pneumoniae]
MTDITELAHGNSLRKKLNRRLNDAYGFQRTSGGKHTTISLSIAECKSVIAALDERLALVEALEKAQAENTAGVAGMAESYETTISMLRSRIAELESRTVKLPDFRHERFNSDWGEHDAEAYQVALREALTAAGIKVEAE